MQCEWPDCEEEGIYPAPAGRQLPPSFLKHFPQLASISPSPPVKDGPPPRRWFCLKHIREFNKAWDFFDGMGEAEIEQFRRDAETGHRRTRPVGTGPRTREDAESLLNQAFRLRDGADAPQQEPIATPKIPKDQQRAMNTLGITPPLDRATLRKTYRTLVKQYHPDRSGGKTEAKFQQITDAYELLKKLV